MGPECIFVFTHFWNQQYSRRGVFIGTECLTHGLRVMGWHESELLPTAFTDEVQRGALEAQHERPDRYPQNGRFS